MGCRSHAEAEVGPCGRCLRVSGITSMLKPGCQEMPFSRHLPEGQGESAGLPQPQRPSLACRRLTADVDDATLPATEAQRRVGA
jgi:hypothetical protein